MFINSRKGGDSLQMSQFYRLLLFKVAAKFCSVSGPAVFQANLRNNFFPVLAKVFFQNCWRDFEKI